MASITVKLVKLFASNVAALESFSGRRPYVLPPHGDDILHNLPQIQRASCSAHYTPLVKISFCKVHFEFFSCIVQLIFLQPLLSFILVDATF